MLPHSRRWYKQLPEAHTVHILMWGLKSGGFDEKTLT